MRSERDEKEKEKMKNGRWEKVKLLAACAICALELQGVEMTVQGARKDALYNDDFVVTNVTAELGALATTQELGRVERKIGAAANAAVEGVTAMLPELIGAATNAAVEEMLGVLPVEIAAATNAVIEEMMGVMPREIGAAVTNVAAVAGYVKEIDLVGYATQGWVTQQAYASKAWTEGKGYRTATNLAGYATKEWTEGKE